MEDQVTLLKNRMEGYTYAPKGEDVGIVLESADGVARIGGLRTAMLGEMLEFPNQFYGLVFNLEADEVVAVVLGNNNAVRAGDSVKVTGKIMQVPVGNALLGRVVNALGEPIDGKGPVATNRYRPVETKVPGVIDRTPVDVPMQTGYKVIDALIPIGRGQRELIIGDRKTGKTTLAIDTIINQKDSGVICVYVAVDKKSASVAEVVETLRSHGAMDYTIVVDASADDPAAMQYLAPYSGTAMAEEFMYEGKDVLVIYDDLTKHANAYRMISLLLKRPPGREAFPGDIFYLHSRLLERAARVSSELGGGSITALPIIETQRGDISTYVPTNVISITDGQIFLSADLFYSGFKPAINAGISVSRVGGKAQIEAIRKLSGPLRLELARFREQESFTAFASELDAETQKQLHRGQILIEILKQDKNQPMPVEEQVISVFLAVSGILESVDVTKAKPIEVEVLRVFREKHADILKTIRDEQKFAKELQDKARAIIQPIVNQITGVAA
ncbi:MAG: F0F1 ATP synthase subunit alpha [Candidatus Margulisiibacteriota bacterium]